MAKDRFLIGPYTEGLETSVRPWLIADDAFATLENAYIYKGRVRKRFGSRSMARKKAVGVAQLFSRLRVQVDTTAAGAASGTIPAELFTATKIGQLFSIDDEIFTINALIPPFNMLKTGSTTTATFDTTSGAYNFVGAATAEPVFFYPALPVMGLPTRELAATNEEELIGFDTRFAYQYTGNAWSRLGTAVWTGGDADFFWTTNYRGSQSDDFLLFVSNYVAADGIQYLNGSTWTPLTAIISNTVRMKSARVILPFKDHLLAFNTIENTEGTSLGTTTAPLGNFTFATVPGTPAVGQAFMIGTAVFTINSIAAGPQAMTVTEFASGTPSTGTYDSTTTTVVITGNNQNPSTTVFFFPDDVASLSTFRNRVRFSQNGSPIAGNAWLEGVPGRGGFIEAPTKQAIVTAEFIKDRLVVYFERSTFELVFTNNEILPFRWQKINTELGAESTFSAVPFDKVVLGVGNVGIHACNGANVERIDQKIEQEVFAISNADDGPQRVQGIRDFEVEHVYWSFPSITQEDQSPAQPSAITFPYPDKVLAYNYETSTWAIHDDSITAFGYYQDNEDETWQSTNLTWGQFDNAWNKGSLQQRFRNIVAGNQQGFVFIIGVGISRNAPALQITNVNTATNEITIIDHNLKVNDFVALENMNGLTLTRPTNAASTDNVIYKIASVSSTRITPADIAFSGTYLGGGTIARVSEMNILSKQYNFYLKEGRNVSVSRVDFQVDRTASGSITVDYFASSSGESLVDAGAATGTLEGTTVLETSPYTDFPLEKTQTRLWHPVYTQLDGEFIQIQLKSSLPQMIDFNNATSDFQLSSFIIDASPTASRLQ